MAKKLDDDDVMAALPAKRCARIEQRAQELAWLKDLHQAVEKTQIDLAEALGVGQDTISRLEQRSDMRNIVWDLSAEQRCKMRTRVWDYAKYPH